MSAYDITGFLCPAYRHSAYCVPSKNPWILRTKKGVSPSLLEFVLVACRARYGNAHHTRQTRLFNVHCVKQWYTGALYHWRISTYILLRSLVWWAGDRTRNPGVGKTVSYHKARCPRLALFGSFWYRIKHITPYNMKLRQSDNCLPIDNTGPTILINRKYPQVEAM